MALKGQKFKKYCLEEKVKIIEKYIWKRNMVYLIILLDNGNTN